MVVDGGLQDDQFLPRHRIGTCFLRVGSAGLSIDVAQGISTEELVKPLDPSRGLRWISVLRHNVIKIKMENVGDRNVFRPAWPGPRCRRVLLNYVLCECFVCSIKVVSLDTSAELATSIKDKPGGSMGDVPGFVPAR
jgi:hypothetical protein